VSRELFGNKLLLAFSIQLQLDSGNFGVHSNRFSSRFHFANIAFHLLLLALKKETTKRFSPTRKNS